MSQVHNHGDSAGVPWEGRQFEQNAFAGDDGSADVALDAALRGFRTGESGEEAIVDALRSARVLIPLIAEKGDEGVGPTGLVVDKTQELSIVTVAGPDGRTVLPVFSCVATMSAWDGAARPIPVEGLRAAMSAASDGTEVIVIDPGSETEFVVRRPAVWALAQGQSWVPSFRSTAVAAALRDSIIDESVVGDITASAGDPQARLRGPELVVTLHLQPGLDQAALDGVIARVTGRWGADERMATLVDSLALRLEQS